MIQHTRRAFVVIVLSLVAPAATAYADCAWVLWATLARSVNGGAYQPEAPTLLTVTCPCGVVFERWIAQVDAELDLLRAAGLN
jgi:hypothetical protein